MKWHYLFLAVAIAIAAPFFVNAQASAGTPAHVRLDVMGCDNNSICEPDIGESTSTCPLDCTVATSTPAPPVVPGINGRGEGLKIEDIQVMFEGNDATVYWRTNISSRSIFAWGKTPDYELATINGLNFLILHTVTLKNLKPATRYYMRINLVDVYGEELTYASLFVTPSLPDTTPPANPYNIKTVFEDPNHGLTISWSNPTDPDFAGVVIVGSPYAFPKDQRDGRIIYEGRGNYVVDDQVTPQNRKHFYTIFAYDATGNYSSGTLFLPPQVRSPITTPATNPTTPDNPVSLEFSLGLNDFRFIQNDSDIRIHGTTVPVDGAKNLTVSLPATKVPGGADEVIIGFDDGSSGKGYFLRLNADRTAYETIINSNSLATGIHPFSIYIALNNGKETMIPGQFDITESTTRPIAKGQANPWITWLLLILLVISIILFAFGYKKLLKR